MMPNKPKVTIFDAATGELIERDATQEEISNQNLATQEAKAIELTLEAKTEARQSALAKLAALGLTEEEIAAL